MAWGKCAKKEEPLVYNSLDELLALLEAERQKTLKHRRNTKIGLGIYLCVLILVTIVGAFTHFHGMGSMFNMFGGFTGMLASMYAATNTQKKGVQALAQFDDVRAVPRLIEMLDYKDRNNDFKVDTANLLQKLLPNLRASDAAMLRPEHHAILNRLLAGKIGLDKYWTEQLRITTLHALQQVGDASSLPIVTELANGVSRDTRFPVAEAAQECLPFLQSRVENQRQNQTLLRASDGNQTSSDVLLRPAQESPSTTSPNELLRAAPEANTLPPPSVSTAPAFNSMLHLEPEAQPEAQIARLS